MLSPLINGKTVSLTKIVHFVLCVCVCALSLSLSLSLNLTKMKCTTSMRHVTVTEHSHLNAPKSPGKKDPAQSTKSNSVLLQGEETSCDHEQRTESRCWSDQTYKASLGISH